MKSSSNTKTNTSRLIYSEKTNGVAYRMQECLQSAVDTETRTLYLTGGLERSQLYRFIAIFNVLDSTDGDINIVLMSEGGDEIGGLALYDTIRNSRNQVIIRGYGEVASIATLIMQAGDMRILSPECRVMIHNGILVFQESYSTDNVEELAKEMQITNNRYQKLLSMRSKQPIKKVKKWCEEETWFSAHEAVRLGFADGVLCGTKKRRG